MRGADESPHVPCCARDRLDAAREAQRCGARTRSGRPCRGPAMRNGRCRLHGGASTGPRTPAGLERARRAAWQHGGRSAEAVAERKAAAAIRREIMALIAALGGSTPGNDG